MNMKCIQPPECRSLLFLPCNLRAASRSHRPLPTTDGGVDGGVDGGSGGICGNGIKENAIIIHPI